MYFQGSRAQRSVHTKSKLHQIRPKINQQYGFSRLHAATSGRGREPAPITAGVAKAHHQVSGSVAWRIAVVGAGDIGAIYAVALAKAGAEVVFVARGGDLAAMRENGLRIEGDRGETLIYQACTSDDTTGIGIVDYLLCSVKLWDLESAGEQI